MGTEMCEVGLYFEWVVTLDSSFKPLDKSPINVLLIGPKWRNGVDFNHCSDGVDFVAI